MDEYGAKEKVDLQGHRLKVSLAIVLLFLGFASIALYMGSTILYPVLNFDKFMGQAFQSGIQQVLVSRYVGYLPLIIFGVLPIIAGNWFLYSKKEIDNAIIATITIILFTTFIILLMKTF